MAFKSHPFYDASDARDWLSLRQDDWPEQEPGPEKTLQDLLKADKPWLCGLALDRIQAAAGADYLTERPHAEVKDFLFFPIGEQGYQVYVEYLFLDHLAAPGWSARWLSSPGSDNRLSQP